MNECIIVDLNADENDHPYKITFMYKTGDKESGNGLNFKSPRKSAKANCILKDYIMPSLVIDDACRLCGVNAKKRQQIKLKKSFILGVITSIMNFL